MARFLDDYQPQKEKKKKNGALTAPRSGNSASPAAGSTAQTRRTTRGTALGGSAATPVQLPQLKAPQLTKTTIQKTTPAKAPQSLQLPEIKAFGAAQPAGTTRKAAAPKAAAAPLKIPEIRAFGAGDYSKAGKGLERAAKTVAAGAVSAAGGLVEIAGQFRPTTGQQSMGQFSGFGDLGRAVRENRETGISIEESTRRQEAARRERQKADQQRIFDTATRMAEKGQQYQQEAKEGLGTVGQFLVDMGVTGTQMAGDALANLVLPGSGLAMMGMRSYGQAAGEARREGKDSRQQFLAGLKSAGIEVFTEKMFGAFSKVYGGAAADELIEKMVKKLTGNASGQALLTWMVNAAGEGVEEVTSDLLNPLADRLLGLDDGKGAIYSTDDLAQWGYDFLLGTAMGALGGGQQLAQGVRQGRAQTAENSYYDDLRRNGLGSAGAAAKAQKAGEAFRRVMPARDGVTLRQLRMPQLTTEEITSIKRVDAPSPTEALLERNIVFRDGTSTVETSVPQSGTGVNTQGMQDGGKYAAAPAGLLQMPRLVDEQGRTYDERLGELQYSIRNTRTMPWDAQIRSYFNGKLKSSDSLYLGTTGKDAAARLGVADAPLYLPTSVITKAERDSRGSRSAHSLERGDVLALDAELQNSAAIVYNPARQSLVYLTKGKTSGKPLVVSVQINTDLFGEKAHKVTSIHNRDSVAGLLRNLGSDAVVLVKNNSELNSLLPGTEIRSLQLLANVELAENTIPQQQEAVNRLQMPRLVDEQGRTYDERLAWQQIPESRRAAFDEAQRIAQRFGARVVASEQEGVNGSYRDGVIALNPYAADPVRQTLIHELTHHMESSGLYGDFRDMALRYVAEDMGADVDSMRQAVMADYAQNGAVLDEDGATREIVAKFAEQKLFTDEDTVRRLLAEDRSLFQRIYDWLRDALTKLTGTSEERFLRSAEKLYAKALREASSPQRRAAQYSFEAQHIPTWEELGAKPDIQIVDIREQGLKLPFAMERSRILTSKEVQSLYTEPPVNKDTGELIFVTPATLTHSFSNAGEDSIYAAKHLREILENAVLTYREPSRKTDDNSTGIYTLFGAVQTENGVQPVKVKVKEYWVGESIPKREIQNFFDKNGVKDPYAYAYDERVLLLDSIEKEAPSGSATANTEQSPPLSHPSSASAIRVQDLLSLVNGEYQKYVPDMTPVAFEVKKELPTTAEGNQTVSDIQGSSFDTSIPGAGGNVNMEKYSTGRGLEEMAAEADRGLQVPRLTTYAERTRAETERDKADVREQVRQMDAAIEAAAAEAVQRRIVQEHKNREMPEALQKLGVAPFGSEADYAGVDGLAKEMRWNGSARRKMQQQISKIPATEKERAFARQLADGTLDEADIPSTVDRETVEQLADYYRTMDNAPEAMLLRQRRAAILDRETAKMEPLLGMEVAYDEGGFRENSRGDRKPSGKIAKATSTLRRNLQTPARICATEWGTAHGKKVYEALFYPVTENNARQIDWVNAMLDRVRTFKDSEGKDRALNRKERELVQKIVEYQAAEKRVAAVDEQYRGAVDDVRSGGAAADAAKEFGIDPSYQEYQDLQNYQTYLRALEELRDSKSADSAVVNEAVRSYSALYRELYDGINSFLVAHGYQPIGFIEGYAPHMQPEAEKTAFSKALKMLGLDDTAMSLPTSISGKTADLKPYKQYNPFFQERHGVNTEYDIAKGFENYVYYLGNIFYHTDDVMRIRAAEKYIRKTYSSEEASEQISWAENARNFPDAQITDFLRMNGVIQKGTELAAGDARVLLDEYIGKLYDQIGNVTRYSEMAKYLDNYANRLAGKQNMADRGAEAAAGRGSLNWINTLTGKYGGAKLAFNFSSALNQTSQLPMVAAENGEVFTGRAIRDFFRKDSAAFAQESNFLKGKRGINWLLGPETKLEKFKEKGFAMTEMVDSFTSYVAVRSKYLKELRAGKDHAEAMKLADEYGRSVMGSRARGEKPMLFDTKNPFWQIVTRFQLEALNSWEHVSRDLPAEIRQMARERGKTYAAGVAGVRVAKYLGYAFILNLAIGALSGGSPVPYDVAGSALEAIGKSMGVTKLTVVDDILEKVIDTRLFGTDGDDDDDTERDWWVFLGSLVGDVMNDVPIIGQGAALLGIGDQTLPVTDLSKVGDFAKSVKNNGFTMGTLDKGWTAAGEFVFGGNQARKTLQGGIAVGRGGVYSKDRLRYQVEQTPMNYIKGLLFGRSALNESQEYYAERTSDFSEKQTEAFRQMQDRGVSAKASYDLLQKLRGIEKTEESTEAELRRDALRQSAVSGAGKWVAYYQTMAGEKELEAMDAVPYHSEADYGTVTNLLMNLKGQEKDVDKMRLIDRSHLTDEQKASLYKSLVAEDSDLEKINALKATGITDYQYLQYKIATSGLTKKEAKLNAINTLDLTTAQKDALYYLNSYASSTHGDAPWVRGMSAADSTTRLTEMLAVEEDDEDDTPKWRQSLNAYLGEETGTSKYLAYLAEKNGYSLRDATESTPKRSYLQYLAERDGVSLDTQDASPGLRSKYLRELAAKWGR